MWIEAGLAANITPSHVYQKTEILRVNLQQQGLLDTDRFDKVTADQALRHPRHVIQKVRECHTILAKILRQHNIQSDPLPELFSVREVRPSDVQNGVEHLLQEARKLGNGPVPSVAFEAGKVPGDVYNNLKRICAAIRADITPSDVYQIATAVNANLDKMFTARGYDFDVPYQSFQNKTPSDVYQKTWAFLKDLRTLGLNPDFAIPGGVIVPNAVPERDITPQDVMALMNDALAETNAMNYTLGIREHAVLPFYQDNMTPSHVYAQSERAYRLVQTMLKRESDE